MKTLGSTDTGKQVKVLTRLALAIALCLVATTLPPLLVQADEESPTPNIHYLSPPSGVPGDTIAVIGNFTAGEWLRVYYYLDATRRIPVDEGEVLEGGNFLFTFEVPDSSRGIHGVRVEYSTAIYDERNFTVRSALTVSPEQGRVGDSIIVTGRGYGESEAGIELYFGGQRVLEGHNIQADDDGRWRESLPVPPLVTGSHTVDTRRPTSDRHATFTVIPGIETDKSSGSPGQSIVMTGGGFTANERNISILFAGEAAATDIWSDDRGSWEGRFEVPEMPAGEYLLTAGGDRTFKEEVGTIDFEVKPGIALEPDEGHVGMNVTATGRGFAAGSNVTVMYEDIDVTGDTGIITDENGSFELTFSVPESRHGPRQVTAEDAEGNETEVPAIFTMEDDPPDTPEPISPIDGQRAGFARKVRPTFEWEEVFDLSGVYYSLQISTSANVTDEGFADPYRTLEGLTGNHTLERANALPHGTYYWIVQAVDGAQNESGWSDPESFRAGRLPLWAFIVIIVFAVLGAGGAFYFYHYRRTLYD